MQNRTTHFLKAAVVIMTLATLMSCTTSMTPIQVNKTLPTLTKSRLLTSVQAEEAVRSNGCKYLVKGRTYTAPVGLTTKNDLRHGAKGIDEWVTLDGGNAYVLNNYKWVTVSHDGSTQLHVEFDTLLCE